MITKKKRAYILLSKKEGIDDKDNIHGTHKPITTNNPWVDDSILWNDSYD